MAFMAPGKRSPHASSSGEHRFGGDWTDQKLEVLEKYLQAYTKALKDKPSKERPFKKAYIDAFAGTGYRTEREPKQEGESELLFKDLAQDQPQRLLEGSVVRALQVEPPFDTYIFIDKNPEMVKSLGSLADKYPGRNIRAEQGDANAVIRKLCSKKWTYHRAVLFLDPYGMQVEWSTIEAVARTKAIDMWLLFPLGIGVNRLLPKSGDIPAVWRHRLNLFLGTTDWYEQFYRKETTRTLFGEEEQVLKEVSFDALGRYFVERLKSVFAGVSENPLVLKNSANNPLYLLCFAAGNPRGAAIAKRIANDLLEKM